MRNRRIQACGLAAALLGVAAADLSAHRLDEFLQAARIAVENDRVDVALSLTPGVSVVESIIGEMDLDRNGVLSEREQRGYVERVINSLQLSVDGRALTMAPRGATFPDVGAFRRGDGIVQIQMSATIVQMPGRHQVDFKNSHRPGVSVYLANALVPESRNVDVTAQRRDRDQTALTIDYVVRPAAARMPYWLFAVMGAAGAFVFFPLRRKVRVASGLT